MKASKIDIFTDIKTDNELKEFVSQAGLIVLNVYSQWCGPCISLNIMFLEMKLGQFGHAIRFGSCDSDTIDTLERFNRTSEPIWLIVRNGKAINTIYGSDSEELRTKVMAELYYLISGVERPSYELNELQPVEIEIGELVADITLLEWKKSQKRYLKRFKSVTQKVIDDLPNMHVTLFGPHVQTNWRELVKEAECLGLHCHERCIIKPTMNIFDYINYACTNPLDENVIHEFVNKSMMLCLWRVPDSCTTEEESIALFEQLAELLQSAKASSISNKMRSMAPNIVVNNKVTKFQESQNQFYAEIVEKYFETIKMLVATLPYMELNEYNCRRMAQLVFQAHSGESPYIKYPPINYDEPKVDVDVEEYAILKAQKDEFVSRVIVNNDTQDHLFDDVKEAKFGRFFARKTIGSSSKESDIFGEEGMDEDLTYLLEYLEEEDEDDMERLSSGCENETYLPLELPGLWHVQGKRARAALIHLYFPSYIGNVTETEANKKERQLVMAFKADRLATCFEDVINKWKHNIKEFGFFSGDDPEEAEFICDDIVEYLNDHHNHPDDRVVMAINYENSETAFDFVSLKPTFVSVNEIYAEEDADMFFGDEAPINVELDFVGFLQRQKKNFDLWKANKSKTSKASKCVFIVRSQYRVPVYKKIANLFTNDVSIVNKPKYWYNNKLNEFLYNNGLRDSLSDTSLTWSQRLCPRHTQRHLTAKLSDQTSLRMLTEFGRENMYSESQQESEMNEENELSETNDDKEQTLDQSIEEAIEEEISNDVVYARRVSERSVSFSDRSQSQSTKNTGLQ